MKLTDPEKSQLAAIFECDESQVEEHVRRYGNAATEEYVRMVLGQRVFTRGSDMREYRLLLLIEHVFDGKVPSEGQISALFQTTASQSRSLLRAVMSKFQYELQTAINKTLDDVMSKAAKLDSGGYTIVTDSEVIVEALNRRLGQKNGLEQPLTKVKNTISQYELTASAYNRLKPSSTGTDTQIADEADTQGHGG